MKFLAVFVAVFAVAASQTTWTLSQLSDALDNPATDPALIPYLEQAFNALMADLYAGKPIQPVTVTVPSVDLSSWSLAQISDALQNPETDPTLVPYLETALNSMMDALVAGTPVSPVGAVFPAMEVTSWTLHELSNALDDPNTDPALVPYLEHALNEMMSALFAGQNVEVIAIATPAGLIPVVPSPIPEPVVMPTPIETPEISPVVTPSTPEASSSPLVQIIVNVKQQS